MHPIASSSNTRKPKKHKEKSQQHKASSPDADAETPLRNETLSLPAPTSAATAPAVEARRDGRVPADYDIEFGDFDFDAVKAEEGAELWLVRAPSSVRLALFLLLDKHTSRACLHPPSPLSLLMYPSAPAQFIFSFFLSPFFLTLFRFVMIGESEELAWPRGFASNRSRGRLGTEKCSV